MKMIFFLEIYQTPCNVKFPFFTTLYYNGGHNWLREVLERMSIKTENTISAIPDLLPVHSSSNFYLNPSFLGRLRIFEIFFLSLIYSAGLRSV